MQVVVSMYFETSGALRMPVAEPKSEAEECWISSGCIVMAPSPPLLDVHEESLVFRRPGVRIARRRREEVGQRPLMPLRGRVAPVNREADVPQLLAVDLEARQTVGHHRCAADRSSCGGHLHFPAVGDPLLVRER